MMSLSPSLFDYIVKYMCTQNRTMQKKCAQRSNRALFDLRDKDKKMAIQRKRILRVHFLNRTYTMIDMSIKHSVYTLREKNRWSLLSLSLLLLLFCARFCLYNKHLRFDSFPFSIIFDLLLLQKYIYNDAVCLYFRLLRQSSRIFLLIICFLSELNNE